MPTPVMTISDLTENINVAQSERNTVMTPNFAHKIVHSSAMYYQSLIIIHELEQIWFLMFKLFVSISNLHKGVVTVNHSGLSFSKTDDQLN